VIEAELARRRYLSDPVAWQAERLGRSLWSKQRAICESVRAHRFTAVHSCHQIGKSFTAAGIAAWWIDVHPPGEAFVVTSAPSVSQVKAVLWREIGRAHAAGRLAGRLNQAAWYLPIIDESGKKREELVALGRKPNDFDPGAFQGIHARYVLVIFDEAGDIPKPLWAAADSLVANEHSRFLAIGNPDDPTTEFAEVCKLGSGYSVIGISAYDSPNFTGEPISAGVGDLLISRTWVEERKRRWGEDNALFLSKVKGEFPDAGGIHVVIPVAWVKAAQRRSLEPSGPHQLGVDVGGGGDANSIAERRGPVVRIIHKDREPNTMATLGNVRDCLDRTGAEVANVDYVGIGKGVVDRAEELGDDRVLGINVGESAEDPQAYLNLRAEGWWQLRERFQPDENGHAEIDIDPDDEELAAQLVGIRRKPRSDGKIQIESKEEMRRRGVPSPNDADALMLSFLEVSRGPLVG
jgi:hypothetical protein